MRLDITNLISYNNFNLSNYNNKLYFPSCQFLTLIRLDLNQTGEREFDLRRNDFYDLFANNLNCKRLKGIVVKVNSKKIPKVLLQIETSRAYGRGLLLGIVKYSHLHGPWAFYQEYPTPSFYLEPGFFSHTPKKKKKQSSYIKHVDFDGIITRDPQNIDEIFATQNIPTIVGIYLEKGIPGMASVLTDNKAVGNMAAEHLLDRGFRNYAYCGFNDIFWSRDSGESFSKRIAEEGYKTYFYKCPKKKKNFFDEQILIADWVKTLPTPIGVMACNDDRGRQLLEACKIAGVKVPDEVAVIGADNDEIVCGLSDPPLSSIALNNEKLGYEAAKLLDKLMKGKTINTYKLLVSPTHVVTRQSSDIIAIDNPYVAEAIRFIREHAKKMIQVDDVVDATMTSRRTLERHFHRELGRSVFEEIKRVRINQIAKLLIETNMSVAQIASTLGFTDTKHIARYFQQEKGVSLVVFREKYGSK